jgi:hypothetical protein
MDENLTPEALVELLNQYLYGWGYKSIDVVAKTQAKLAGFILGACFIDAMASYRYGVTTETMKSGNGDRFKNFVSQYIKEYNPDILYEDLRCGLVHSYASGKRVAFTDNHPELHLKKDTDGMIILNLENFILSLNEAYELLKKDILLGGEIYQNARRRQGSLKIMSPKPVSL